MMEHDVNQCILDDTGMVYLYVVDTGQIVFRTPENTYNLAVNNVIITDNNHGLMLNSYDGSQCQSHFTFKLNTCKVQEVREYFEYWNDNALGAVKKAKFQNFLDFWNFTIDFVRDNIDVESLKPTYTLYHTDYREYDGDLNIHFDVSMGDTLIDENGELDYATCFALNDKWMDEYLDKFFDTNDYGLFGKIFVAFKP